MEFKSGGNAGSALSREPFGVAPGGQAASLYRLSSGNGIEVAITDFGGTIVSLTAPDRDGVFADIVLGYDRVDNYARNLGNTYFGALIGRYANRIAEGRFAIDGIAYQLGINDPPNSLHGGLIGFNRVLWQAVPQSENAAPQLTLTYVSPNGDGGYPGTLSATVVYTVLGRDTLQIDYSACTDAATIVNLTNHSYFNLSGEGNESILPSILTIDADSFTPVDETAIPTGVVASVDGSPFDFRKGTTVGERIHTAGDDQLRIGKGYDHNWVLRASARGLEQAAVRVEDPRSGRALTVRTTQPGLQFYSGNQLDGTIVGKSGRPYLRRCAFVLETQHYPDSPNHPNFPSTVLLPGQTYHETTTFQFTTMG